VAIFAADAVAVADDAGREGADAVTAATRVAGGGVAAAGRGFTSTGIGGGAYVGATPAFAVTFAGFGEPADATVAGRTLAGGTVFGRAADATARGAEDATAGRAVDAAIAGLADATTAGAP